MIVVKVDVNSSIMFLNCKFGYPESLDFTALPEYGRLKESQQAEVCKEYERAYRQYSHIGLKVAGGRAFETAVRAIAEQIGKPPSEVMQSPPSIFADTEI
jgi:hypothetical protein